MPAARHAAGRDMAALGMHPRLAHMVLRGRAGTRRLACGIAALLSERDRCAAGPARATLTSRTDRSAAGRAATRDGRHVEPCARPARHAAGRAALGRMRPSRAPAVRTGGRRRCRPAAGVRLAGPDRPGQKAAGALRTERRPRRGVRRATAWRRSEYIVVAALDAGEREARIQLAASLDPGDSRTHFAAIDHGGARSHGNPSARPSRAPGAATRPAGAAEEPLPAPPAARARGDARDCARWTRLPAVDAQPRAVAGPGPIVRGQRC